MKKLFKTIAFYFEAAVVAYRYKRAVTKANFKFRTSGTMFFVIPHGKKFVVANWFDLKKLAKKRGAGTVQDIISTAVYTAK